MFVLGKSTSTSNAGKLLTTLYLAYEFEEFHKDSTAGRSCVGQKVTTVYIGDYDARGISVGDEIEIYYGAVITTPKGTFQPIKKIEILNKEK